MQPDAAALCRTLDAESAALSAFVSLLREEQLALIAGDLDRVTSFAETKSARLFELQRLGDQRVRWLRDSSLTVDGAGMSRLLSKYAGGSAVALTTWRRLLELTKTAQQLNDTNGNLISTRLGGTKQALSVLFSSTNAASAYSHDGSTVSLRSTHELAVA